MACLCAGPMQNAAAAPPGRVHHADLYGLRKEKYAALDSQDVNSTPWQPLAPAAPNYYFVPQDIGLLAEYERGWKVTEAMPMKCLGFPDAPR